MPTFKRSVISPALSKGLRPNILLMKPNINFYSPSMQHDSISTNWAIKPTESWSWELSSSQLVEHCTGIAEVMGSNPVQAWIFFRLSFHNCLSCVVTARIFLLFDLSSAVQIYVSYIYIHLIILPLLTAKKITAVKSSCKRDYYTWYTGRNLLHCCCRYCLCKACKQGDCNMGGTLNRR